MYNFITVGRVHLNIEGKKKKKGICRSPYSWKSHTTWASREIYF